MCSVQITKVLRNKWYHCDSQFGFRAESTNHATLNVTHNIYKFLDKAEECLGVYLDLVKHSTLFTVIFEFLT